MPRAVTYSNEPCDNSSPLRHSRKRRGVNLNSVDQNRAICAIRRSQDCCKPRSDPIQCEPGCPAISGNCRAMMQAVMSIGDETSLFFWSFVRALAVLALARWLDEMSVSDLSFP